MNNLSEQQKAAAAKLLSLRADSRDDVRLLAEVIDNLGKNVRPLFAAAILELGIMKFEDRLLRWTVAFCKWRNRPIYAAMVMVFNKFPGMAQDFIEQTAEHVLHGRDESSVTSVGGWNQDEINMATRLLVEIATNALENSNG